MRFQSTGYGKTGNYFQSNGYHALKEQFSGNNNNHSLTNLKFADTWIARYLTSVVVTSVRQGRHKDQGVLLYCFQKETGKRRLQVSLKNNKSVTNVTFGLASRKEDNKTLGAR